MAKAAPTPFGGVTTKVEIPKNTSSTSSSSAFPPMAKAAPTPFGGIAGAKPKPSLSKESAGKAISTRVSSKKEKKAPINPFANVSFASKTSTVSGIGGSFSALSFNTNTDESVTKSPAFGFGALKTAARAQNETDATTGSAVSSDESKNNSVTEIKDQCIVVDNVGTFVSDLSKNKVVEKILLNVESPSQMTNCSYSNVDANENSVEKMLLGGVSVLTTARALQNSTEATLSSFYATTTGLDESCDLNESTSTLKANEMVKSPQPLVLHSAGARAIVTADDAIHIIDSWKSELEQKRAEFISFVGNSDLPKDVSVCQKIVLSNKSYEPAAAKVIADFISSESICQDVQSLDLSDVIASQKESDGLEVLSIFSTLFKSSKLREVDLSCNAMGCKGVSSCASILSLPSLKAVYLCNNGLSETSMHEVADILIESKSCERLKTIHFYNNMSGDGGCEAFSRIMNNCSDDLENIRFSGTRAQRKGSLLVAGALRKVVCDIGCNLQHLDLCDNSFGRHGASLLSSAISSCPNLQHLDLRDCILEDEGIELICEALNSCCQHLRLLDISGNDISKDASKSIALTMAQSLSLEIFRAEENELTSIGIRNIMRAIKETNSLKELSFGSNECGSIGVKAIISAKRKLGSLTSLHVDGNSFTAEDISSLEEAYGDVLEDLEDNTSDADADFDFIFESDEEDESSD